MVRMGMDMSTVVGGIVGILLGAGGFGVAVWLSGRAIPPLPIPSPPPTDLTLVVVPLIEANARLMEQMMTRGLEAVVSSMERATYGPPNPSDDPVTPATLTPPWGDDAPPWADWPEDGVITEQSDRDIQDWADSNADRGVVVSSLPDFSGENLDVG